MHALLSNLVVSAVLLGSFATPRDGYVEIPLAEVPEVVRKAADRAVPRARWEEAGHETVEGRTHYNLFGDDDRGREVVVELTADGEVLQVATEIAEADVPAAIKRALQRDMPDFHAEAFVEASRDGKVDGYFVDGTTKDGKEATFAVDVEGREIKLVPPDVRL